MRLCCKQEKYDTICSWITVRPIFLHVRLSNRNKYKRDHVRCVQLIQNLIFYSVFYYFCLGDILHWMLGLAFEVMNLKLQHCNTTLLYWGRLPSVLCMSSAIVDSVFTNWLYIIPHEPIEPCSFHWREYNFVSQKVNIRMWVESNKIRV